MYNTLGQLFRITSFGESHGKAVGVVIDGCPAGMAIDLCAIQEQLDLRKPGTSHLYSSRRETDEFEIISGLVDGKTTGHPICILIPNTDAKPEDYKSLENVYRPSHADFTYQRKYGIRDKSGGGRSSARITAGWVAAGSIAMQIITHLTEIEILSFVRQVHKVSLSEIPAELSKELIFSNSVRCPNMEVAEKMEQAILEAKEAGDSLGGIVSTVVKGVPVGLGEPVFQKLSANLGKAVLSINAVKGFEIGSGFDSVNFYGSELNDEFISENEITKTSTNHSGGIQGGISNGMPILFNTIFKPTSSVGKPQTTVNMTGDSVTLESKGRHDPCVVPRAVPIVTAMTAMVLLDHWMMHSTKP